MQRRVSRFGIARLLIRKPAKNATVRAAMVTTLVRRVNTSKPASWLNRIYHIDGALVPMLNG